jgi:hypothetical protein
MTIGGAEIKNDAVIVWVKRIDGEPESPPARFRGATLLY